MKVTELQIVTLGIAGIIGLETLALLKGVDGAMFGAAMAALGTIIGYVVKTLRRR